MSSVSPKTMLPVGVCVITITTTCISLSRFITVTDISISHWLSTKTSLRGQYCQTGFVAICCSLFTFLVILINCIKQRTQYETTCSPLPRSYTANQINHFYHNNGIIGYFCHGYFTIGPCI